MGWVGIEIEAGYYSMVCSDRTFAARDIDLVIALEVANGILARGTNNHQFLLKDS